MLRKELLLLIAGAIIGVCFEEIIDFGKKIISNYPEKIEYKGKIVDSSNGTPIPAIKFTVVGDPTIRPVITNINGVFKVMVNKKNHERYISYYIEDTRIGCPYQAVGDTVELMEIHNPENNKIPLSHKKL